jgi:hypothetical protein
MKSPKMPGPSHEEMIVRATQRDEISQRDAQLEAEEAARKRKAEERSAAIAANRIGIRSLLSGDWRGFSRDGTGADLEAR